ncbi:uncharacterized protein FIBRA_04125 [Fibroporia radiculosa]|uniref:Uncharacterized protein n=1 Tax=Fibroporia radiculosa TaxID=599839 RepID=J4H2S8_9APHY|nr:uncharacterized protein FIBRA_04125 [Fibroporia radiculosa]CCM02049.1 predicted protein [Fibroporia radiculosa]
MVHTSLLANPQRFIVKINGLSDEGITIDKGVARAKRDAADFADKYVTNFQLVSELQASLEQFSSRWVKTLQDTRDAASSISAWYLSFVEVFISMLEDVTTDGDVKDVIKEFNSLLDGELPSNKYPLDSTPGVKDAFNEIEALVGRAVVFLLSTLRQPVQVIGESTHIVDVLKEANAINRKKVVEGLKKELVPVKTGAGEIRQALNKYATKLD